LRDDPQETVLVNADEGANYGTVIKAMDEARQDRRAQVCSGDRSGWIFKMSSAFASIVEVEERRLVRRSIAASILIYASLGGFVVAKGWLSTLGHASAEAPTLEAELITPQQVPAKLYETKGAAGPTRCHREKR